MKKFNLQKITKKYTFFKSLVEKFFIPLALFILWIVLSLFFNSEIGFTVLSYNQGPQDFIQMHTNEMLAHQKVDGQFTAVENNAGIVAIRFNTYIRINNDQLIFRIKEKGANDWYYQNYYKVDQFQPDQLFTFGFPLIKNSKGKIYQFEIESTKGKPGDAVAISSIQPVFVTKYQFPREELLHQKGLAAYFVYKKLLNSFNNIIFLVYAISYLIPLLFYLLIKLSYKRYILISYLLSLPFVIFIGRAIIIDRQLPILSNLVVIAIFVLFIFNIMPLLLKKEKRYALSKYIISFVFFIALIGNILILADPNIFLYILIFVYWLAMVLVERFDSSLTLSVAIAFLAFCPLFVIGGMALDAERLANLCYLFLIVYVFQTIYEMGFHPEIKITYKTFFNKLHTI